MDTIRLRTLAWKSILGFGKYYDLSVLEVYNLQHTRYLRWCYYNLSMISFSDEILEAIHIYEQNKIEKPGKDKEKGENLDKLITKKLNTFTRIKMYGRLRSVEKKKLVCSEIAREKIDSKRKRQAKNHGKI